MVLQWIVSQGNFRNFCSTFSETFAALFPNRQIPGPSTIKRVLQRFATQGTVNKSCKCQRDNPGAHVEKVEAVVLSVAEKNGTKFGNAFYYDSQNFKETTPKN